ncbi:MauE/DoxX family redox-associated membrane protein [Desulfopila sp. IMCC35008]|uniref:MauE/DoxX family redox-associated membrane protein n=1 Tax=Desulfopila sp. IMCC35008 TaxID=2653858 RepID=UPI0013D724F9|nr:MauE/DoxX family redox-associated membrane protein [Desulfopila sp. IMCC35008]
MSKAKNVVHGHKIDYPLLLDVVARWLLAIVFLGAAIPKILSPTSFAGVIGAYGLVPEMLLFPVALAICWGEFFTAMGLLFNKWWALLSTLVFMLIFIAVLSYGIYLGLDIDCGCFGPEDPEHKAFSGLRSALGRDLFLMIPLLFACRFRYQVNKKNQLQEKR